MSDVGYNGFDCIVRRNGVAVAAVNSKTLSHIREAVIVTTDDDQGARRILPKPGLRAIDTSVEGVVTANNMWLLDEWEADTLTDIDLVYPDGTVADAEDGFFFGNIEISAPTAEHVAFTAQLMSSGAITFTPAS